MTSAKKIVAGTMLVAFAIAGTAGAASAHSKNHHFPGGKKLVIVLGNQGHGNGCGYYYWKWQKTGSFAWKSAYMECIGAW